ncbi:MAG: exodeoxyribonuclease VII large subunit [Salinivirgaceae bacterium]|jgi:exodeoxyribonuclease VII large subunit
MTIDSISLSQLANAAKSALKNQFPFPVWVVAEISEMNLNRNGHCYLELIEKESGGDKILAKTRATIWAFAYRMIQPYFETTTNESLHAGLKVLVKTTVEFHEVYGFSLNIVDIDPQYTLGEIALKRAKVIQQLKDDGVFDMNRLHTLALVPQRIAVISSETAAGYGDFYDELTNNPFGFGFYTELFPAVMQGEQAPQSIIEAFERVYLSVEKFDVVALLRGGGSKSDLSCFDDYNLAYYITQFPLPVLTGIGHERDDSIADMVAHTRLKTPTAIAVFLVDTVSEFNGQLDDNLMYVNDLVQQLIQNKTLDLEGQSKRLQTGFIEAWHYNQQVLMRANSKIEYGLLKFQNNHFKNLEKFSVTLQFLLKRGISAKLEHCNQQQKRLIKGINHSVKEEEKHLEYLQEIMEWADPQKILDRGYSIVSKHGKIVKSSSELAPNDVINIKLAQGSLTGLVNDIQE